ncbi:hypothetical protein GSI_03586 [Ganoderma sinense ZZ0214-1]|uniref:Uncharacterized protein n=1 Tax=Ganoderma sinense ZZ0214-1 TaxID=1077348 RepID=A0A2G8SJG5_9APHY|nr:hypothetical protein GSI_03586 [Ganoderma sinense ZZ0214-1]
MCRSLAQLIDDDVSVRYKIELARAGRIDGTPSVTVMVVDRLTSLLKHRARSLHCSIYSLARGEPHPNASRIRISSSIGTDDAPGLQSWDSVQVLGDLIAWNIPASDARICEMKVVNWKTGVTVWEFYDKQWHRCRLVSESHVVVVTFESLLVYAIDRDRQSPAVPSTTGTALCALQLPAWSSISNSLLVQSYIQFPPSLAAKDRPLYRYDPSLTLLTLDIDYIIDTAKKGPQLVQYAVFVPVATILAAIRSESPPPAASASPPDGHISQSPGRVVPWSEWGPAGTHVAHFDTSNGPCDFSPMGCSCAVTQQRRDAASGESFLRVLVFDVHPWARPDPQRSTSELLRDSGMVGGKGEGEGDTLSGLGFTESVRTTFPFDFTRRDIPLGRDDRSPTVVLGEDGLVLVTAPA